MNTRSPALAVALVLVALRLPSCNKAPESSPSDRPTPSVAVSTAQTPEPVAGPVAVYAKDYDFGEDWFSRCVPVWSAILGPLKGQPNLRYLEVGVYEGRSFFWVLDNVLTHPTSRLTGIDIAIPERLTSNIKKSGQAGRITIVVGSSQMELRKLPPASFDVIYIDGSHTADDVLSDAVMSWLLVKPGGLVIFDDYAWTGRDFTRSRGPMAPEIRPRMGIDAFFLAYRYEIEVVHLAYQLVLRKKETPCTPLQIKQHCSPFGQYAYDWNEGRLRSPKDPATRIEISPAELKLIETALSSREGADSVQADPVFIALRKRLDLKLP